MEKLIGRVDGNYTSENNLPKMDRKRGMVSQNIGLYYFALDECDTGVEHFQFATEQYRRSITDLREQRETPSDNFEGETTLLDYLYCTLLSREIPSSKTAAELVLKTEREHYERFSTEWRYYYTMALAASILENGEQHQYLDQLQKTIPTHDQAHEQFFTALWTALSGIKNRGEDEFCAGINQFLDWHDKNVDFDTKTSATDLVCKQVAALIVLARRNGMDVYIDSEYIPECVYELV